MPLEPFLGYRNLTSAQYTDEDVPTTSEVNSAIEQGYTNNYVLTANVHKSVAVPTGSKFALFCANADIWVKVDGVSQVPSKDIIDGTGSELNPSIRYLDVATTIGIISENAAKVAIMFYK
jgi:hypothetical protein